MRKETISSSAKKTESLGKEFAKEILRMEIEEKARVISLEGELGGGKTTFVKGFARGLGIKEMIKSPTFVIMKKYKLKASSKPASSVGGQAIKSCKSSVGSRNFKYFYHVDCYRIENPKEISNLTWKEIVKNPQNIIAVEWGEKIKEILPEKYFQIAFEFINKNTRKLTFKIHD